MVCGFCGAVALDGSLEIAGGVPERMVGALRHRGPDGFGAWRDDRCFLGHARLSIIDLEGGFQPLTGEEGRHWLVFNGEIFNYRELGAELASRGHTFRTRSDSEVIVHAYQEWGDRCVERFNGQFAFALWDRRRGRLFLARDRFGIRPLFVTRVGRVLLFASEIKALGAWPGFTPRLDRRGLAETFTFWTTIAPATAWQDVAQLPAGCTASCSLDDPAATGPPPPLPAPLQLRRYWRPEFLSAREDARHPDRPARERMVRTVREKLATATALRLRADVPVGAYLSGGLDSAATAALVRREVGERLDTFSVTFEEPEFDERDWQQAMAAELGTSHHEIRTRGADIAASLADVVWHAEAPILRMAPAPLYTLSGLVRDQGWKVVLTGEGADEVFCGYNIFKEAKVRAFWARDRRSVRRPRLLTRLYPYLAQSPPEFLARFYGQGLERPDDPAFSHQTRWNNTGRMVTFLSPDSDAPAAAAAGLERLVEQLPADFARWGPVARAQYLEISTFLSGYLLCSQGDRMLMGHSVEGRFPFLDHEVAGYAFGLPAAARLPHLREKALLKDAFAGVVPAAIRERPKQPYRAPDGGVLATPAGRELVGAVLAPDAVAATGLWNSSRVANLVRKWEHGRMTSAREIMAMVGLVSTQLLARSFGEELAGRLDASALPPGALTWVGSSATTERGSGNPHGSQDKHS
jgi:asparagine synthase (glutamine-hydrolysing)